MRASIIALLFVSTPALAQQPGVPVPGAAEATSANDARVNQLIIYGDDPCPQSADPNEITVCARLSEDDRFRVPPNLRQNPNDPSSQSWANRAIELSYVGRTGTESCSTVGGGGFTGCFNQIVQQARAERNAPADVNWTRMIEEARQRRQSEIEQQARDDEAAAQAEERANQPD